MGTPFVFAPADAGARPPRDGAALAPATAATDLVARALAILADETRDWHPQPHPMPAAAALPALAADRLPAAPAPGPAR